MQDPQRLALFIRGHPGNCAAFEVFPDAFDLVAEDERFEFSRAADAHRLSDGGHAGGKVVLIP
jgi:hypothetical protein